MGHIAHWNQISEHGIIQQFLLLLHANKYFIEPLKVVQLKNREFIYHFVKS